MPIPNASTNTASCQPGLGLLHSTASRTQAEAKSPTAALPWGSLSSALQWYSLCLPTTDQPCSHHPLLLSARVTAPKPPERARLCHRSPWAGSAGSLLCQHLCCSACPSSETGLVSVSQHISLGRAAVEASGTRYCCRREGGQSGKGSEQSSMGEGTACKGRSPPDSKGEATESQASL